ncbi:unnamed protein product, partial [Sphacelaria rigidula]
MVLRGAVDLYVFERGGAAGLPTAASQENFAIKATRGQPMQRPRFSGDRVTSTPGVSTRPHQAGETARRMSRLKRQALQEEVEAELIGSGPGPRRPPLRNLAPRWKACRLGPGSMFGDRSVFCPFSGDTDPHESSVRPVAATPAIETAVTVGPTELLAIGARAYHLLLAEDEKRRLDEAVAVLRATNAMDGVPTLALQHICRYVTEVRYDATSEAGATTASRNENNDQNTSEEEEEEEEEEQSHDKPQDTSQTFSRSRRSGSVICRQGSCRRTAFFIADGQGEVIDPSRFEERFLPTGESTQQSGHNDADVRVPFRTGSRTACRSQDSLSSLGKVWECGTGSNTEDEGWSSEDTLRHPETSIRAAAVLTRGDFFGVSAVPIPSPDSQVCACCSCTPAVGGLVDHPSNGLSFFVALGERHDANIPGTTSPNSAGREPTSNERGAAKVVTGQTTNSTVMHFATKLPTAVGTDTSPKFRGVHKASLVAGAGGVRCLTVGLAVLERLCPPVHRRLARVAATRYAEWMAEAGRRYDEEWNERLENESVQSLSRSFYKSFAKGHYSGYCGGTSCNDGFSYSSSMESLTLGGSFSHVTCRTALSCDRSEEDSSVTARHGVIEASQLKDAEGRAPSREKPARRSIFDLTRAFRRLRACSSARTVLPVRLGRALPQSSVVIPPAVLKTP